MTKIRSFAPNIPLTKLPERKSPEETATRLAELEREQQLFESPDEETGRPPVAPHPDLSVHAVSDESPSPKREASDHHGRRFSIINVDLIDQNPHQPRTVYTNKMIKDLADDLRISGQRDPIHVIPNPGVNGRYIIADGWSRVMACKDHQVLENLLAEVHEEMDVVSAAWFGYDQNERRNQHCDYDRACFYKRMLDTGGISQNKLAVRVNISKTEMSYYMAFLKMPPDILTLILSSPEKFKPRIVYILHQIMEARGPRVAERIANKFLVEGRGYLWMVSQKDALIENRPHKLTERSRYDRFQNGFFKVQKEKISLSLSVPDDRIDEVVRAIEGVIKDVCVQRSVDDDS